MGIAALTHRDDGTRVEVPSSQSDWQEWASAASPRNHVNGDPLLDWLELYGDRLNAIPREELDDYNADLDFGKFVAERAAEFRAGIRSLLAERHDVVTIARSRDDARRLDRARETFAAMQRGAPVIQRAVLRDAEHRNYGSPDFLIRSDVLRDLFPQDISEVEANAAAPDLESDSWHYRVVNVKYMTLELNAAGTELGNSGNAAHKAELYVLNRMLGRLQGFLPPASYVLGRGWRRTQSGQTYVGDHALERLGPVPQTGAIARGIPIADAVAAALAWLRRVRTEGADWQLLPQPSVSELYPNMTASGGGDLTVDGGSADGESAAQWVGVKKYAAGELKELTQLWQVGVSGRQKAHAQGIYRWDDPRVTPEAVGVGGAKRGAVLERLLTVNRTNNGPAVLPARIEQDRQEWGEIPGVEFYVDFEFCSDLNDDFTNLPVKGGRPIIFMVGCGHVEDGQWRFKSLATELLTSAEEARIIREWLAHMANVRDRLDPGNRQPRVFHWSHAETGAYRNAKERHGRPADWPELGWYDFLDKVMRAEPVTVKGALDFGLKSIARAMRRHGLIETEWDDGNPVDGLGAMVGAWRCDDDARRLGVKMSELSLMKDIAHYNEVDCKAIMEIVYYLRANH